MAAVNNHPTTQNLKSNIANGEVCVHLFAPLHPALPESKLTMVSRHSAQSPKNSSALFLAPIQLGPWPSSIRVMPLDRAMHSTLDIAKRGGDLPSGLNVRWQHVWTQS